MDNIITDYIPPVRGRLDTEETPQINNSRLAHPAEQLTFLGPVSPYHHVPIRSMPMHCNPMPCSPIPTSCNASVVSSLSNGSNCRQQLLGPILEDGNAELRPPTEISVIVRREIPDWLRDVDCPAMPPPPLWTGAPSPARLRPSLGRYRPVIASNFPVKACDTPTATSTTTSTAAAVDTEYSFLEIVQQQQPHQSEFSSHSQLLGQRPRRRHHRNLSSTTLSVGSLVGQSSYLTPPMSVESSLSSSDRGFRSENISPMGVMDVYPAGKRSLVRNELKYVWGKMSSPIRHIIKADDQQIDLQRSSGCLT